MRVYDDVSQSEGRFCDRQKRKSFPPGEGKLSVQRTTDEGRRLKDMKKKTRRFLVMVLMILSILSLTACGKYNSSWSATAFAHSNTSKSASMSFWKFDGTIVFKLKCKDSGKEVLKYSGKLDGKEENGTITVYYDDDGTKKELFSLKNGESVEATLDKLNEGTVHIIVETDNRCENGELEFNIE